MAWFRRGTQEVVEAAAAPVVSVALTEVMAQRDTLALWLEEALLTQAELALEDVGWRKLTADANVEFSEHGQRQLIELCQLMAITNPLLHRGLSLRTAYTWGEGVDISAAVPKDGQGQDVNAVVQSFLDDPSNRASFSGAAARNTMDTSVQTDGSVFFALFTSRYTGRVQVRLIPRLEITDVIRNPDDRCEDRYYRHEFIEDFVDVSTGYRSTRPRTVWHPALGYAPAYRPPDIGGNEVAWDSPVLHHFEERPAAWRFGLPVAYRAISWARAYAEFLRDWAVLVKALSRYAYKTKSPGRKQGSTVAEISRAPAVDPLTREPQNVGATYAAPADSDITAVPKTGATIDSGSGRPLAMMVSSALGLPVTMVLADPGQTGARATAETLDRPTELTMSMRRQIWEETLRRILDHVIDAAVAAGTLAGKVRRDLDGRTTVTLDGDQDRTVNITWPELDDVNIAEAVGAIVDAASTRAIPMLVVARLLLQVLQVDNIDEVMERITGPDGEFLNPDEPPQPDPNAPPPAPPGRVGVRGYHRGPRTPKVPPPDPAADPQAPAA